MKELGKITKSTVVSLKTQTKTSHTLSIPITEYGCENLTVKKAVGKILIHLQYVVGGELYGYPGPPPQVDPRAS